MRDFYTGTPIARSTEREEKKTSNKRKDRTS